MRKKFDSIPKELNQKCINEVIARVEEIDSDQVGMIAAQDIIDIVVENYGPEIYNHALRDAKQIVQTKVSDMEYEIDELSQVQ